MDKYPEFVESLSLGVKSWNHISLKTNPRVREEVRLRLWIRIEEDFSNTAMVEAIEETLEECRPWYSVEDVFGKDFPNNG